MEVVFAASGMPFGPETLKEYSLGGSETALLMVAKEMRKRGHLVNIFTILPAQGRRDYIQSGAQDEDGIRWIHIDRYADFISSTEVDLLIVQRNPKLIATTNHAKKRVLWMHDIATTRGMGKYFDQMSWTFDEVWCVSKWHRKQINEATNYPLKNIKVFRNGIVPIDLPDWIVRSTTDLVYAARPERGLPNLIGEGGIMEFLPEFKLKLSTYDNQNHDLAEFYAWCGQRIAALPNVETPQALSQSKMRERLAQCRAYIYPTQFEETSCIIARECIATGTPMLTTRVGALPETLGKCGLFYEDWLEANGKAEPDKDSVEWRKGFAEFTRWALATFEGQQAVEACLEEMTKRTDLYWGPVAVKMLKSAEPEPVTTFSRVLSLVEDGDVVPAKALIESIGELNWAENILAKEIHDLYPFLLDKSDPDYQSLSDYYNKIYYAEKGHELQIDEDGLKGCKNGARYQQIANEISQLKPGSVVVEYGAGEGHVIVNLARDFPQLTFVAFDQVHENIKRHGMYPGGQPENLTSIQADTPDDAMKALETYKLADAVICVEVLEHNEDCFTLIDEVETFAKPGGRVIITTPFGPWERETWWNKEEQYHLRNHIWHFTKNDIREIYRGKKDFMLYGVPVNHIPMDDRSIGWYCYSYTADHKPVNRLDPLEKALNARVRQSVGAAIIAYNNEDTIIKTLNSLNKNVRVIQIAHGPSTDSTLDLIRNWANKHPHIYVRVKNVKKIAAPKKYGGSAEEGDEFGFDDARNASVESLESITDWILWIDTDEYLAGYLGKYLRGNCLDGYLIAQHHFTVEPRGGAVQIDRPARLFRSGRGYRALGHIHEHFEVKEGGPGHCFMLPDVDIGHPGYVDEQTRRRRFARNYPFLVWDHEEGEQRRLHPFLWFRDIIHRMRYAAMGNDKVTAIQMAQEALDYWDVHKKDMGNYGGGLQVGLQYLTEARKVLGKGIEMKIAIQLDDRTAEFAAQFLDESEVKGIIDQILTSEFKVRTSRYY